MKYSIRTLTALCLVMPALFTSCKKSASGAATACTTALHGYTTPISAMYAAPPYTCSQGIINTSTGSMATMGSFSGSVNFTNKAAFNTSDNCYYVFGYTGSIGAYTLFLYKINASGAATAFAPADSASYLYLVYNSVTNNLYCMKNGSLAEITFGASAFSAASVATPVHLSAYNGSGGITADYATGNIYYVTYDSGSVHFYVEQYHPGASASTVIASSPISTGDIFEMRFNKNDNMLYGIKQSSATVTSDLMKINPSGGAMTTLGNIGFINADFYTATIDQCANRYIISTLVNGMPLIPVLLQLNMAGTIVQDDTTATFYQGLDAAD